MKGIVGLVTGVLIILVVIFAYFYYVPRPCCPLELPPKNLPRYAYSTPTPLLPISAQQAGDASDNHSAPISNTCAFTWDHGAEKSVVLPPLAVTRGINSGRPVESSTLPPRYMDGSDG